MGAADEFIFDERLKEKIYNELKTKSGDNKHAI